MDRPTPCSQRCTFNFHHTQSFLYRCKGCYSYLPLNFCRCGYYPFPCSLRRYQGGPGRNLPGSRDHLPFHTIIWYPQNSGVPVPVLDSGVLDRYPTCSLNRLATGLYHSSGRATDRPYERWELDQVLGSRDWAYYPCHRIFRCGETQSVCRIRQVEILEDKSSTGRSASR